MKIIKNKCYPLFIFTLLLLGCFGQKKAAEAFKIKDNEAFKQYLTAHNIPFKTLSDTIFNKYYMDFFMYKKKMELEANPYLKVNKVYVHQINSTAVEFTVYADEGSYCVSTYDLVLDNIMLSKPVNRKVKVLKPIILGFFGDYEINGNAIKTRLRHKSPYGEYYTYLNGIIKNDTIFFNEKYVGKNPIKFNKIWLGKTRKTDFKEFCAPSLIAKQFLNDFGLINFEITGEFDLDSPVQPDIKFEK